MSIRVLGAITTGALALLLLGPRPAPARESLDLPRAINLALAQNRNLVQAALSLESGALGMGGAATEFETRVRPRVSAGLGDGAATLVGLTVSRKLVWGTELVLSGSLSKEAIDEEQDLHHGVIQVEVRQPLFRHFGALAQGEGIARAAADLKSARRRLEMQKADLVVEVAETYENILRLRHQLQAEEQSLGRADTLCKVTRSREVLGRSTRVDTLRAELLRGQTAAQLEADRERLASAERDFAVLLGYPPEMAYDLQPNPLLAFTPPAPVEAVRTALQNRLDYAQVLQDAEVANRGVRIARQGLGPDLTLVASNGWVGEGSKAADARHLDRQVWFVGLTADTDFNTSRERIALGRASIDERAALQAVGITEVAIARQVQQQLLALGRAREEVGIAAQNAQLARGRTRLARRLYELGRGENFSVTDAEEAWSQAQSSLLAAQAEASGATYRMLRSLGTLVEAPADLKPALREGRP